MMVCLFTNLTFGLYRKKVSNLGAWASIHIGRITWCISDSFKTRTDPTIYATLASCAGMILGSLLRPKLIEYEN